MAAMDEFRKEREAIKHAPFKEKAAYIWDYYKWFIIVGVLLIAGITSYIYSIVTKKDVLLYGVLLNVYHTEADSTELVTGFYEFQDINTEEEQINLSSQFYNVESVGTLQTLQTLTAWNSAGHIDFITCSDVASMTDLAYRGYFTDLTETLNPVDFEKYSDRFYYMDEDVLIRRREAVNKGDDIADIQIPDPTKPEEMVQPIPVFMKVTDSEKIRKAYGTADEELVFGISPMASHPDMALRFLEYIME